MLRSQPVDVGLRRSTQRSQLSSRLVSDARLQSCCTTAARPACASGGSLLVSRCSTRSRPQFGGRLISAATQPSGAGTSTVTTPSSSKAIKQEWAITIKSEGTGAVDKNDDGRRLRLTLLDENGNELYNGSTDGPNKGWTDPDIDIATKSWSRSGVVMVEAPPRTAPAVLKIAKDDDGSKPALDYIAAIAVTCSKSDTGFSPVVFMAQRWLSSKSVPGSDGAPMVLFASARLPQDETAFLKRLRETELKKIRGEDKPQALLNKRDGAENIYDYQTYNDLGKKGKYRPPLGGKDWPYPRRLATNRASEANNGSEDNGGDPWLPFEERFNFTKAVDFSSGTISAGVPAVFAGIDHVTESLLGGGPLGLGVGLLSEAIKNPTGGLLSWLSSRVENYNSFADVTEHYSNDSLPSPLSPALSTVPDVTAEMLSDTQAAAPPAAPPAAPGTVKDALYKDTRDFFADMDKKRRGLFQPKAAKTAGDQPPQPAGTKVAVSTLLDMAANAISDGLQTQMKEPRVLQKRSKDVCGRDEEFGRQMLAGFNPSVIQALKQMPSTFGSAITEEDVKDELGGATMQSLVDDAAAGKKPRLYMVDYWNLTAFFTTKWEDTGKVLHAGRAILYLQQDAAGKDVALVPIVIELAAHPNAYKQPTPAVAPKSGTVFSRSKLVNSGQKNVWDLAKLVFRSLDVGVHQLVSHWLRCHAAMEPFLIALKRCISTAHPLYKLMLPHFRYTMAINASARGSLINADGIIERTFAVGEFAMRLSSIVYGQKWRFENQALPADLQSRGMVDASGKPFLDYPYAADGLRIWRAMETYFGNYLALYYGSGAEGDEHIVKDTELQAWWTDVTHSQWVPFGMRLQHPLSGVLHHIFTITQTKAHPDVALDTWGVKEPTKISSKEELVRVLVTIAWTASAHHAAVNFAQYDYTAYPLNAPSLIRKPIPRKPADKAWQDLVKAKGAEFEAEVLRYINSPTTNLLVALTVTLLSTHSEDEHLLDEVNTLLTDTKAKELNKAFIAEMKQLEKDIKAAHETGSWTRCVPGTPGTTATYSTCLIPGSAPGLTMRGVPYSVSI